MVYAQSVFASRISLGCISYLRQKPDFRRQLSTYERKPLLIQMNPDIPAKLKNPITSSKALESTVLDGDSETCSPTRNDTEEFLQFSLDREAVVYATIMCWEGSTKTIKISGSVWQSTYYADSPMCGVDTYRKTDVKTGNITVQVSSESASSMQLCVVEVFTKDDKWCGHPPLISVPNGQLEVGRNKATLHCNEGFKERNGREVYATCENNKWSYQNLTCGDGKPETDIKILDGKPETDYKTLAIVFGCVVVIMILILVGLKIFLILRKKTRGVVVKYKPGEDNSFFSPLFDTGHSTIDRSEPECIESKTSE
ncbi:hypothetical protein AVEN_47961-1 [Araneus ventricosus]|uniref:Sushi domain-containing protein n=1 Tax=Araneus ventricosus TaxID=182803 RepID=A0A4Y2DQR6_ARAVE|nr:hypothetical protein AVEN_47961-1 [Araneus ventricosus]